MQTIRSCRSISWTGLFALLAFAVLAAPAAAGEPASTSPAGGGQTGGPAQLAQACPRIYRPVCAFTRGGWRTYSNSCVARNAGARLIRQGACRAADNRRVCCQRGRREFLSTPLSCRRSGGRIVPERFCRRRGCNDRRPVCGRWRGRRYDFANICELRQRGGRFIHYGRCRAAPPPQRTCHQRGTSRRFTHIRGRSWPAACSGAGGRGNRTGGGVHPRPKARAGDPCTGKARHGITFQGRIVIDRTGIASCMPNSGRP
jgi:hypothetical protein